jgi:broad specificity phosphatase PhoE
MRATMVEAVLGDDKVSKSLSLVPGYDSNQLRNQAHMAKRRDFVVYSWSKISSDFMNISHAARSDDIYFYRHGATNYNQRNLVSGQHDTLLSPRGREQARNLRSSLPNSVDFVACSALIRTIETMELSALPQLRSQVPIYIDARLNEVSLGELQGKRRRHVPEFTRGDIDFAPPGGETYRSAAQRVFSSVIDLFNIFYYFSIQDGVGAVFCHAGVLRIIATLLLRDGQQSDVFKTDMVNGGSIRVNSKQIFLPSYWIKGGSDIE